jgi:predicted DNA-binding transcriptional regulator YafY
MKLLGSKLSPDVMKKLVLIGEKQGSIRLNDLSLEIGLSPEDTLIFLRTVFPGGLGAEVYTVEEECMVDIDANALQYMLPLTPSEWLSLHDVLSQVPPNQLKKNSSLNALKKKVTENGPIKAVMELLNQLENWDSHLSEVQQEVVTQLDQAVERKQMITILNSQNKNYSLFPCKVIHLEGKLSMIAEDIHDHCLIVMALDEIVKLNFLESTSGPRVTAFELEEFINAIRSMNEKETRLILKIHDPQSVNLFPDHHFLGKPCMITNPNGDLIWAAYVEPCDDLFEWLLTLGSNVEILDPGRFKDEFLSYCEEKLRKIA